MWSTLKTALTSILLFIAICFGANAAVSENHVLGDFLAAQHYIDENPEANQLASLESFGFYQKHASECCNATNRGVCSFHGDTLVALEGGDLLPIRDVRPQMSVISRDPVTGEISNRLVTDQYSNPYEETVSVAIRDVENGAMQTIVSNRIHPYFVQTTRVVADSSEGHVYTGPLENGHWVDAGNLVAGDRLLNADGSWAEVVSVEIEETPLTAYNLTVEGFHTYFVAANKNAAPVWVHNDCLPQINKAVNSNMGHAADRAVERGVFGSVSEARIAYQNLSKNISKNGWPEGTIKDPSYSDRYLVPVGNNGYASYQLGSNGTARLKTTLIRK